jgi:type I restriction enzyme S subunit
MGNEREFKDLPEGWRWVRLEEDVILMSGSRPKGGAVEEGIPSLGGEHISEDGRIIFTKQNAKYIPDKFFKLMPKGKAEVNDILINKDGANTGKVAILKVKFHPHIAINEHLFILRSKKLFEQKYLFYWLYSSFAQTEIRNRITGSAQPGLSSSFIKNFFLPLHPLPEQQKIAEILETVDNAIEKTEKIIEKYKRIKQGLMQDLLTKGIDENGNIRNEKTHKFKDSPLGRIPEEWEVVRLGEVGEIIMGQSPASALVNQEGNGIPFLQGSAEFGVKYPLPKNWIVKPLKTAPIGSILISVRAPVGDINIANNVYGIGRGLSAIKINDSKVNNLFIWYNIYFYRNELVKISQGSTFEAVGYKELNNFLIPLPPLPEQQRIAEILSQIDKTIEKEEQYKEKLKRLKQGLMEDLLTGKVRVNHLVEEEEK